MIPEPLHPAVVHFPIVLALLLPVAVGTGMLFIRRGARARPVWSLMVALSALLFAAAYVSVRTGQAQEETVEDALASERPLHEHEEAAERFLILSGILLVLSPIGLLAGRAGTAGRTAVAVGSVALAVAIWPVGESGGDLVYEHGAAQAYIGRAAGNADVAARADRSRRGERDDDGD